MPKVLWLVAIAAIVGVGLVASSVEAGKNISGDYVEARTASVFAGACHFNGEVVTTGRDAVMAWNIKSGEWDGVSLAGTKALAVVNAESNLAEADRRHNRRAEIVIDERVDEAQSAALISALKMKYGEALGEVTAVRRAAIDFRREAREFAVRAAGVATLEVEAMPNDECCRMPSLVWYSPLVKISDRKVGYTSKAFYAGGAAGETWQRSGENSAFYGTFAF